jgi:catechol 2,3-dioxygenase-like lactoylglutathione lyase family enzyme
VRVLGIVWMGVRTPHHDELRRLFADVMGMPVTRAGDEVTWFGLPRGEEIQIYGASDVDHRFFTDGPTIGFLVDDFESALGELAATGIEFLGEPRTDRSRTWVHFRGPDGNVYEILGDVEERVGEQRTVRSGRTRAGRGPGRGA